MNRAARRKMVFGHLSRLERLGLQEQRQDIIRALVKPKHGTTKAMLRRRRKKE
jgi:hypothetical protein